jgi:transposase
MTDAIVFKSRAMQTIEGRIGESLDSFLERRYTVDGMTDREIAPLLGVDYSTVARWRAHFGIEGRAFGPRRAA